jgi:hypothetical protein
VHLAVRLLPPFPTPCHSSAAPSTGSEPDSEDDAPIAKRSKAPAAAAAAKGGASKPKAPPSSSRQKPPAAKRPRAAAAAAAAAADSDDVVMISSDSEDGGTQAGQRSTAKPRGAKKQVRGCAVGRKEFRVGSVGQATTGGRCLGAAHCFVLGH